MAVEGRVVPLPRVRWGGKVGLSTVDLWFHWFFGHWAGGYMRYVPLV